MSTEFQPPPRRPVAQVSTILTCALLLWIGCCAGGLAIEGLATPWAVRVGTVLILAGVAAFCTLVMTLMISGVLKLVKRIHN